jgi:hypothetical protein
MADPGFENEVLRALAEQGSVVGILASDEASFRGAYEAFRAEDANGFQSALARLDLIPRRFEICEWIRSKECVFVCLALAGRPRPIKRPDPRALAEAIVRLTADEQAVAELAQAVEKRDPDRFQKVIIAHKLGPFAHLFCHWVCVVRSRLICQWVCSLERGPRPDFVAELQMAGKALGELLARDGAFDDAVAASDAGDAEKLGSILKEAGLLEWCRFICEWFCSWRCTLACLILVRQFAPPSFGDELAEAHAFAASTQQIAQDAAQLERLSVAVGAGDAAAFGRIITELKFQRIALQLCHWICSVRCRLYCRIVCPPVTCELTSPVDCTGEQADPIAGFLFVPVLGTAGGSGSYTLTIRQDGDPPIAGIISYPGGGSSGTAPVIAGELGRIDTSSLSDSAYTITLEVHSGGLRSPVVCTRTTTFNLLKIGVYISQVAGITTVPSPFDEQAELTSGGQVASFGGALGLAGSAYVYGCATQKIERYELRYARVTAPGPGPLQPATDAPIPAEWPASNQLHGPLVYDPSKYYPCTRVGQAPTNLINDWGTMHVGAPAPGGTDYPILLPTSWQSRNATGSAGGRYNLLLIVHDTLNHDYYDLQRIWIDNWSVLCEIVKFQRPGAAPDTWEDIPVCTDILISWEKLRIIGLAWDHLIDDAFPATPPNDNFQQYSLSFHKQFVAAENIPIATPTIRVPNDLTIVPTSADADVLAEWDLTTLDAGPQPAGGGCESPLPPLVSPNALFRGCSCAYDLSLSVSDTTLSNETGVHSPSVTQPIKIVNDLP